MQLALNLVLKPDSCSRGQGKELGEGGDQQGEIKADVRTEVGCVLPPPTPVVEEVSSGFQTLTLSAIVLGSVDLGPG